MSMTKVLLLKQLMGLSKRELKQKWLNLLKINKKSEERVAYKKVVSEHSKKLEKFVAEQLAKEVKELRDERAQVGEHVPNLMILLLNS